MSFVPALHFEKNKLTSEWANSVVGYYWTHNYRKNLLDGKDVAEIDGYAEGNYDLKPYKRMFIDGRIQAAAESNINITKEDIARMDKTGIQYGRVALIAPKLNSAIATQQKIPLEILVTCLDALAQKKKQEDLDFLRNKEKMKEVLQPLYDSMNLGDVDLGATKHSSVPFTGMPMDLDAEDEDDFRMFANMIYNLAPESALEVILDQLKELHKLVQIKGLNIRDQYKYAVAVLRAVADKNTDLPSVEYIHPGRMWTDWSALPDYSDNIIRVLEHRPTPLELFKFFPDEICDEDHLEKIINFNGGKGDWGNGYAVVNGFGKWNNKDFNTQKMSLLEFEIKSVDSLMIAQKPKSKFKYFTDDEKKCKKKVWAQNTYTFFWLVNTKHFFGIDRLGFAYRSKGSEIYTGFSTVINKTQEVSAVEHCVIENKKAQMADIKCMYEIIMSRPSGVIIDMKYIRNAIEGQIDELNKYTEKDLLSKGFESNRWLIDTEGFENKQIQGQNLPIRDMPGGLKDSIVGYYTVRAHADRNISAYLSVNEQLTGQSATPEGLVGTQKLLLSYSINGLYYVTEAIEAQYQTLFNIWAYYIQEAIKKGGAGKKAIENIVGTRKLEILRGLDDVPLHQIGIKITLGQREEERANNKQRMDFLYQNGVLNDADIYEIQHTINPKDSAWLIAVKQNRWQKKQDQMKIAQMESNQKMIEQQGQNMLQNTQMQTQGKVQEIQATGAVEAELMKLGNQLGLNSEQLKALLKLQLQDRRLQGQTEKSLKTIYANQNAKQQEALV